MLHRIFSLILSLFFLTYSFGSVLFSGEKAIGIISVCTLQAFRTLLCACDCILCVWIDYYECLRVVRVLWIASTVNCKKKRRKITFQNKIINIPFHGAYIKHFFFFLSLSFSFLFSHIWNIGKFSLMKLSMKVEHHRGRTRLKLNDGIAQLKRETRLKKRTKSPAVNVHWI